jgi:HEAT repeat protein
MLATPAVALIALSLGLGAAREPADGLREVPRRQSTVSVSTEQPSEGAAKMARDGVSWRAWITARRAGDGATVTLSFAATRYLRQVVIWSGDQRNSKTFRATARPATVTLSWDGGSAPFPLADRRGAQTLLLPALVATRSLKVVVTSMHGSDRRGLAIGEVIPLEPVDILDVAPEIRDGIVTAVAQLATPESASARARLVAFGEPARAFLRDVARYGALETATGALEILHQLDPAAGLTVLQGWLASADPHHVRAAWRLASDLAWPGLAALGVSHTAAHDRVAAAGATRYLCALQDRRAVLSLVALLGEHRPEVAGFAAGCLAALGAARGSALERLLASTWTPGRVVGLETVTLDNATEPVLAAVQEASKAPAVAIRKAATEALGRVGDSSALARLGALVGDAHHQVRIAAARGLLAGGSAAAPHLSAALDMARSDAAEVLLDGIAAMEGPAARDLLVRAVAKGTTVVWSQAAARGLAKQGPAGVRALVELARRDAMSCRGVALFLTNHALMAAPVAAEALAALGPESRLGPLRIALLKTLAAAGDKEYIAAARAVWDQTSLDPSVRAAALEALGQLRADGVGDLALLGISAQADLSSAAVRTLARAGDLRLVAPVMALLRARHPRDWLPAHVEALGQLGIEEAVPLFPAALYMGGRTVRSAILTACLRIGSPRALSLLFDAAVDRDPGIRQEALELLRQDGRG